MVGTPFKPAQDLFDEFKRDHFRGFSDFWVVPSGGGGVFVDAAVAGAAPASAAPAMVKPLNMSEVLDASKEKMFASIVPDSSAKPLSRYTEMVDDIIRTQAEKLQQGSELALGLRHHLTVMGLRLHTRHNKANSSHPLVAMSTGINRYICFNLFI
ncbi:hypothetical protein Hanom_Chr10g00904811 [Helianthus anomalus]